MNLRIHFVTFFIQPRFLFFILLLIFTRSNYLITEPDNFRQHLRATCTSPLLIFRRFNYKEQEFKLFLTVSHNIFFLHLPLAMVLIVDVISKRLENVGGCGDFEMKHVCLSKTLKRDSQSRIPDRTFLLN